MPELDIITGRFCTSYWGVYEVPSNTTPGMVYIVTLDGGTGDAHCTCKGFEHRGDCSHLRQVNEKACLWNSVWGYEHEFVLDPVDYHYGPERIPGDKCPNCGGGVCPIRVGI